MCKKLLLIAVVGGLAFAGLKSTKYFGYAKEEVAAVGDWIDSKVPFEKKMTALEKEIRHLDKEIEKANDELAREIVDVNDLTRDVARERAVLGIDEKKVRSIGELIKDSTERTVAYGRQTVTPNEAKAMLDRDVRSLANRKATLANMETTLATRERIKESLTKQVEGIRRNKLELTANIDKLRADYKELQLQQIESKYQFDDTKLAKAKESLRGLQKEIDVTRQKLKMRPSQVEDGAPATGLSVDEILSQLDAKPTATPEKKLD